MNARSGPSLPLPSAALPEGIPGIKQEDIYYCSLLEIKI
jgi:hypothetical protein